MIWTVEFFQLKMMPVAESKDNYIIYIYIYQTAILLRKLHRRVHLTIDEAYR